MRRLPQTPRRDSISPIRAWSRALMKTPPPQCPPPEIDRGPVYEFHLNHVLVPESPTALFRTEYQEL
jgi:hypothetical protein